jgi:hypothetical protein
MEISAKETLMYFSYTYAPNLTHQGASVITKKFLIEIQTMDEETINTDTTYFQYLQNQF